MENVGTSSDLWFSEMKSESNKKKLQSTNVRQPTKHEVTSLASRLGEMCSWPSSDPWPDPAKVVDPVIFELTQLQLYVDLSCDWVTVGCSPDTEFLCVQRQYCISSSLRCDHIDNCGDRSDEMDCSNVPGYPGLRSVINRHVNKARGM